MIPPLVFPGRVTPQGQLRIVDKQGLIDGAKVFAGKEIELVVQERTHNKTRLQEKGFHAMIQPWAHHGGHRIDELKRDLLREIFGEIEHLNPITGELTLDLREPSTAKLKRAQYSELIERTLEIAARCGYVLIAPAEWKERQMAGEGDDED